MRNSSKRLHGMLTASHRQCRPQRSTSCRSTSEPCARAGKSVYDLGPRLGVLPSELLNMINGRVKPTKAVLAGLARELDSDVSCLERLAAEIVDGKAT
jgi:hypothetical protein